MSVSQYYEMNPDTEEVLFDGNDLRSGMVVLIENPQYRAPAKGQLDEGNLDRVNLLNRWCTVKKPMVDKTLGIVSFLAVYEGGIVRKRTHNLDAAWIVKIDSIP